MNSIHFGSVCFTFLTLVLFALPVASQAVALVLTLRSIDGVDQTDFLQGKSDKSNREGFRDWWTSPIKLGSPKAFNLITVPTEEYPQT